MWCGVVWCGVVWCGVVWCGVVWCGVVWCGVVWCGVVWCGVVWCGVVWCGVVWCGVVWCGVVWCGVVWCGVVCRRRCYQKAKGRDVYPRVKVNGLGCVCCVRAVRKCVGLGRGRGSRGDLVSSPLATALIPGAPAAPLPFCLLVQAQLLQRPRHRAARAQAGLQQCGTRLGVGVPDPYGPLHDVAEELRAQRVGPRTLQVGQLHGGGPQGCRPLLQHSRFPQLVTHWGRPWPHLLVEPRCEAPAG